MKGSSFSKLLFVNSDNIIPYGLVGESETVVMEIVASFLVFYICYSRHIVFLFLSSK